MRFSFPFLRFSNFGKHFYNNPKVDDTLITYDDIHVNKPNKNEANSQNNFYIDILGIRLEYDDILLIGLLFFLYEEKVDDTLLYVALILLLLS